MTVREYVYTRPKETYGRQIRLLDKDHKYMGQWWVFPELEIKDIKITAKFIFIFV